MKAGKGRTFAECLKLAGIELKKQKKALTFDEALRLSGFAADDWITMKGSHIEVGEGGEILHGAEGKFKNINDVPRKTVAQRKGESMKQTHERAKEVFKKQDDQKQKYEMARLDKDSVQKEISRMSKTEHDAAMKEREGRSLSEWKNDPPAFVENSFVDRELKAGNISKDMAQTMKDSVSTRIEQENAKGDKLLVSFSNSNGNFSSEPQWVPKKYLVSEQDAANLTYIPF